MAAARRSRSLPALASRCRRAGCRPGPWRRRAGRRRSGARGPSGPGSRPWARTGGRWRRRGSGPAFRGAPRAPPSGCRARRPGVGADGFQPRLLDRLEGRLAVGRAGPGAGVGHRVVVGQAQGHLVGQAADARGLLGRSGRAADAAAPPACPAAAVRRPRTRPRDRAVSASERAACARARLKGSVGLSGLEAMASGYRRRRRRKQGTPCAF
jgi:hypothetical protein